MPIVMSFPSVLGRSYFEKMHGEDEDEYNFED